MDKRTVLIDVGYKSMQRFFRSELDGVPIYSIDGVNRGVPAELMVRPPFKQEICADRNVRIFSHISGMINNYVAGAARCSIAAASG